VLQLVARDPSAFGAVDEARVAHLAQVASAALGRRGAAA
jgi:hypothetical protein